MVGRLTQSPKSCSARRGRDEALSTQITADKAALAIRVAGLAAAVNVRRRLLPIKQMRVHGTTLS